MLNVRHVVIGLGMIAASHAFGTLAQAQDRAPRVLQREARIRELEQLQLDARLRVNPDVPPEQRAVIDYGGYVTFNYLSLDDTVEENHVLRQYDLVLYSRILLDNANEIFLRGSTGWRDFNDGDSFDGRGDERIDCDLDRGYYSFSLASARAAYGGEPMDTDIAVKAGRDLAYWANGLVLAQVIDGVVLDVAHPKFNVQLLGGVTRVRTVDFDPSRPAFDHNTRRGFFGGMLSAPVQQHNPFIYGLIQRDWNDKDEYVLSGIPTEFEYNSYYIGVGSTGNLSDRLRYGVEFAYEFGDSLSNSFEVVGGSLVPVPQSEDDIHAWGLDARLDYVIPDEHQTRLGLELIVASGDSDRSSSNSTFGGNEPGTRDDAFNAFGLVNTGLAFGPAVSNLTALRVGASTMPFTSPQRLRRFQIGVDFFVFGKLDPDAPIDEPTLDEWFLGVEGDVYVNWQITSDVVAAIRYGAFFPSSSAFPSDEVRQFIYGGLTFAF
jgi:hypothetical protein